MKDTTAKPFSRRSFLTTGGSVLAAGMAYGLPANPLPSGVKHRHNGMPHASNRPYQEEKRSHPSEGIKRENITITDIKVTPLSYVHDGDYLWRVGGLVVWKSDAALVQVFTSQGIVGIGEASPYRGPDAIKQYTDRYITPLLKGQNVFDVDFITNNQGHNTVAEGAWAGVNNALWDVIGKTKGKPVYQLLSGERTPSNKVHMYASGGVEHAWYDHGAEDLIAEALRYKEAGFDTFKFRQGTSWKFSGMTMEKYIPVLQKLRQAVGPDFRLCIEKFPWEMDTILNQLCPVLEELKFYWYEEPVSHNDPQAIERHIAINEAMPSVMVSGGESFLSRYQVHPFTISGAMDIIQADTNLTGISEGWHIGQLVHQHGKKYCPHNWVGGLTTLSNIHLVAGVPSGHMCETNMTYNPLKWEIFQEPYPIEDGWLTIPDKPGYGVELIDDLEKRFPFKPGFYGKPNPKMKGSGLPLWWS